jgi:hypothetical protein
VETSAAKPATAARMYDYFLGGFHNFPADREAADQIIAQFPDITLTARANRSFVRRVVRELTEAGVRQFLDIGSGIPTVVNVHEVAQTIAPETRVVYVDLDPVAVGESQEILDGNPLATALRGDMREPSTVLDHPEVRRLLDFSVPVAVMLNAVLHFVDEDAVANTIVSAVVDALPSGGYLSMSHAARETFGGPGSRPETDNVYKQRTSTPAVARTYETISGFFAGLDLLEPGIVWLTEWRPAGPDDPAEYASPPEVVASPVRSGCWAAVGRKP